MPNHLGRVTISVEFELELQYDDAFLWAHQHVYILQGQVRGSRPSQQFNFRVEIDPQFYGETFIRYVEQVVMELALKAVADPAIQALTDQYTERVVSGQFRPPV